MSLILAGSISLDSTFKCMYQVDFVMLGAEGVCESGGIVNQLGSLPIAIVANKVRNNYNQSAA
jgi:translation initiation factor 2B subunit (eIF-2B alpha/beta/delta family)